MKDPLYIEGVGFGSIHSPELEPSRAADLDGEAAYRRVSLIESAKHARTAEAVVRADSGTRQVERVQERTTDPKHGTAHVHDWALRQMSRLQLLAEELSTASSTEQIAELTVDNGVAALGARAGSFHLVRADRRHAQLLRAQGLSDELVQRFALAALDQDTALAAAMSSGEPLFVSGARYGSRRYRGWIATGDGFDGMTDALALLPLSVEGTTVGCVSLLCSGAYDFAEHVRAFLSILISHCTEALRRLNALEQERRSHERLRVLVEASDLLARTLDYEPTLRTIVRLATPTLADFCFLDVVEDGRIRRIASAHDDPATLQVLEQERSLPTDGGRFEDVGCFQPYLDDLRVLEMFAAPEQLELFKKLRPCSLIAVPLHAHGEHFGVLTLCYGRSRRHHVAADLSLADELALRAAQAVSHARLYEASQTAQRRAERATRQAEEASRLKDEFLTTVSHELRTPLSAILGWAMLLRRERNTSAAALDKGLEVIERNARAQQRIIEDILDVSRMVCGKFRLKHAPLALEVVAREVCESLRCAAAARNVELVLTAPGGPHWMFGDADRLRQILWNLVSNGVKFTPAGGIVHVQITRIGQALTVTVRDTGDGIDPEFLPYVFQHFRQADGTTTRAHGGLGLGLAMVRHLTEMHGGTVSAESDGAGKGATFTVRLPIGGDPAFG